MPMLLSCLLFLSSHCLALSVEYSKILWEEIKPAATTRDPALDEMTLLSLQRKTVEEDYHSRFSVVVEALKGKEKDSLSAYSERAVSFLKSQRFQILSVEPFSSPTIPTMVRITAQQRDFGLTFSQFLFLREGKGYLVTGTTRTKVHPEQSKELEQMVQSLKFN